MIQNPVELNDDRILVILERGPTAEVNRLPTDIRTRWPLTVSRPHPDDGPGMHIQADTHTLD